MSDLIDKQAAIDAMQKLIIADDEEGLMLMEYNQAVTDCIDKVAELPPVKPQYTDTEIQKMQDLEFAEIQKAYEIGKDEGSEVLDKIRAEIDSYCSDNRDRNDGLYIAMRIIDKYKASPTGEEVE